VKGDNICHPMAVSFKYFTESVEGLQGLLQWGWHWLASCRHSLGPYSIESLKLKFGSTTKQKRRQTSGVASFKKAGFYWT